MSKIEVRDLVKKYKKRTVIDKIDLKIENGDVVGIVGENGAGKSTFMAMLVTLLKPTSGDILYDNESIVYNPKYIRGDIGYVPQDIALYEDLSGMDNLKFWASTYHIPKSEIKNRIERIRDIVGLDDKDLGRKVKTYSGGMKRRVNIGVALLNNPDVIVMDEPTVGIDIVSKDYILKVIKKLNNEGKTIVYVSHYFDEIEEICNKICIMNKGRIIDIATVEDIKLSRGTNIRQYYLDKICCNDTM